MHRQTFHLAGDYIELHNLLKLVALASSGGAAKHMVAEGTVTVDGVVETRKTRKLRHGSIVRVGSEEIEVLEAPGE